MGHLDLDLHNVPIGLAIVLASFLCTRRIRTVLVADALISLFVGLCTVLFANDALKMYTAGVSIDNQHEYLMTARVALLIMPSLTWLFVQKSTDVTVRTALVCSRIVGYGLSATFMLVEHYRMGIFTPFHIRYCVLPCCLWVMVMTVHLIKSRGLVKTRMVTNEMNGPLRYDLTVMMLFASADIIAPKFFGNIMGRTVEPMHAYLHRINGGLAAGAAVLPWVGQRFREPNDKRALLSARVIACTTWLVTTATGYHNGWLPATRSTLAFMAQATVMMLPALYGWLHSDSGRSWQFPPLCSFDPYGILGKIRSLISGQGPAITSNSNVSTGSARKSRSRSRSKAREIPQLSMVLRPRQNR